MADMSIRKLYQASLTEGIKECTVSGWVRTVRDSKAFGFIEVNDGTYFKNLQIVLEDGLTENFSGIISVIIAF